MTRLQSGAQVHDLRVLHVLGKEPWGQKYRVQNETGEHFELLAFVDEAPSPEAKTGTSGASRLRPWGSI